MVRKNCDGCGNFVDDFEAMQGGLPEGLKQLCEDCYKEVFKEIDVVKTHVKELEEKLMLELRLKFATRAKEGRAKAEADAAVNETEE